MKTTKISALVLAAALQVMPVCRVVTTQLLPASSPVAVVMQWVIGAIALLGSCHAVSGASTVITSPKTARGTNAVPFAYRITTGPEVANQFNAAPLPPGLTVNRSTGRITGTPTASGLWSVLLTASDSGQASRTVTATLALTVVDGANGPPRITTQPQSKTVIAGANVVFSTVASGSTPLYHQWRYNDTALAGQTSPTLTLNGVTLDQAGDYTVVVTNGFGAVTSAVAVLTVNPPPIPPSITTQPQSQTVTAGANVSFSVAADGTAPLAYRWRYNNSVLAGQTNSTLMLNNVTTARSGNYSVVVTNIGGAVTSAVAVLTVNPAPTPPTITLQPQNRTVTTGANVSFTVAATGTAPFAYQWRLNSSELGGETGSALTLTNVTPGHSGGYSVVITNPVGSVTSAVAVLVVSPPPTNLDVIRPKVAIVHPVASLLTNDSILLHGAAWDNIGVRDVLYAVNDGPFHSATGSVNWASWGSPAPVPLIPGTNYVRAYGVDLAGNASPTNTRMFFRSVRVPLSLSVNGSGWIGGATNGQRMELGRTILLWPRPAPGFVFSNWVVSADAGVEKNGSPVLTCLMRSNLAVSANFIPNPFKTARGRFDGLFYEPSGVQHTNSGFFVFVLTDTGAYSALLLTDGRRLPAFGRLSLEGKATNVLARVGAPPLTVAWDVNLGAPNSIVGTVSDGTWTAPLAGNRYLYHPLVNPCTNAGKYTFVFPGTPAASNTPEGHGYGVVLIDRAGLVTTACWLADGTPFLQKVPLSTAGEWPLYASLYLGKGSLLGWLHLEDAPAHDLTGLTSWLRPAWPGARYYPDGITDTKALVGSRYVPPLSPGTSLLNFTNASVLLTGGNLAEPCANDVLLSARGVVTNVGTNRFALVFNPLYGLFRGGVVPPGSALPVAFGGAALQKADVALGFFLGTNQSGAVSVQPR